MCDFIDNTKIPWMRMIRKGMPDWEDQKESWKILRKAQVDTVRKIAHQFYTSTIRNLCKHGKTPLHFAVRVGNTGDT